VAAPFVEWMLLGTIAWRYQGPIEWDAQKRRITNQSSANAYLQPKFRKGWKFV
jgi:hypothetical protein